MTVFPKYFPSGREMIWLSGATLLFVVLTFFSAPSLFHSIDYVLFYKPNFYFLIHSIREGHWPLWNPHIGLGRPFLADVQNAVFYPPVYLIALLGIEWGLFVLVCLHCLLAVFGMIIFSRAVEVGKVESYLVSFSYLASAALTGRFFSGQIFYVFAACYLPLLFFFALKTGEKFQARTVGIYALLLALQFLCGHPQVFWISGIGQAIFICGRASSASFRTWAKGICADLGKFGVAAVWCGGLVAIVVLPFLELITQSNRQAGSIEFSDYGRMEWGDFLGLFIGPQSNFSPYWEMNYYFGLLLLFPALRGFFHFRDRNVRALLGVVMVSILISLGANTPVFKLLYRLLPGIESFRLHSRVLLLLVFVLLVSAGIGLTRQNQKQHDRASFVIIGMLLAMLTSLLLLKQHSGPLAEASRSQAVVLLWGAFLFTALAAVVRRGNSRLYPWCFWALAGAQTIDLATANMKLKVQYSFFAVLNHPDDFPYRPEIVKALKDLGLLDRSLPPPRVAIPPDVVPVNYGMMDGFSHFDAYVSLFLERPWKYLHESLHLSPPLEKNTSLSREVYQRGPFPYRTLSLALGWDPQRRRVLVHTNSDPRIFLVFDAREIPLNQTARMRASDQLQIRERAWIEEPLPFALHDGSSASESSVKLIRFEPNSILVDVDARENALLLLSEAWYPGWRAKINGEVINSVPANGWMRAFPVRAGRQRVEIFFRQNYLALGGAISLISVLLLVLVCRRPKGTPTHGGSNPCHLNNSSAI